MIECFGSKKVISCLMQNLLLLYLQMPSCQPQKKKNRQPTGKDLTFNGFGLFWQIWRVFFSSVFFFSHCIHCHIKFVQNILMSIHTYVSVVILYAIMSWPVTISFIQINIKHPVLQSQFMLKGILYLYRYLSLLVDCFFFFFLDLNYQL